MRLRNVKNKLEIMKEAPLFITNPKDYRGRWASVFGNDHPIYIEIGMGKGKFIVENARRYPQVNFIGIEKYDSVIVRALEKVKENPPANLRLIRMDATAIEEVFEREVTRLYLNFSDPWPKARHAKRRLTSDTFLKRYDAIFKEAMEIIQKTDNRSLFEFSLESLSQYGYHFDAISLDLYRDLPEDNISTEYESRFVSLGQPIYRLVASKANVKS